MENKNKNTYCPDYAIAPGETLLEVIESKGITQAELANRMGRPKKTINEIIKGKAAITPETAIQLERVLGVSANLWNNLEKNYRSDLAKISEAEHLKLALSWSKKFPIKKMIDFNWLKNIKDEISTVDQLLKFFGVASVEIWTEKWGSRMPCNVYFRKSKANIDRYALFTWLRRGEIVAKNKKVEKFNKKDFYRTIKACVDLTNKLPNIFQSELVSRCAKCGVSVVFTKELPKVPIYGITRWINSDHVMIQLSLRYKTNDQFWFSFFHEAGHVYLHGKRDFVYDESEEGWEDQADEFAQNTLIDRAAYNYFVQEYEGKFSMNAIRNFANSQGIAPGIIVGRLQHDGQIPYSKLNNLKQKFHWK